MNTNQSASRTRRTHLARTYIKLELMVLPDPYDSHKVTLVVVVVVQ